MIILASFWNAFGLALLFCLIGLVVGVITVWLSNKFTGGRGLLYDNNNKYGPDDWRTVGQLEYCVRRILDEKGYEVESLVVAHTVGNKYTATFFDADHSRHEMDIVTDGWSVSYSIDGGLYYIYKK